MADKGNMKDKSRPVKVTAVNTAVDTSVCTGTYYSCFFRGISRVGNTLLTLAPCTPPGKAHPVKTVNHICQNYGDFDYEQIK